jgi:aspartate 1-decarboxylase
MRTMLRSKIHRATVTDANLSYEGSISIDQKLLKAADILQYEKVSVLNVSNGARFDTYALEGKEGEVCVNVAAARLAAKGDVVIILTYCEVDEGNAKRQAPKVILLDSNNIQKKK